MAESWANSGVDLHLDLGGLRSRKALEHGLRAAVRNGRLAPGTRLPPSRGLARDLGIARNTVAEVYAQLVAEGWFAARQGAGTWIAERLPPGPTPTPRKAEAAPSRPRYDLRPGAPDLTTFPRTAWLAASRRALTTASHDALGYGDPRGRLELRRELAGYLARARGVHTDPDHVIVCSGHIQALSLLARSMVAAGRRAVAMEAHGLRLHRDTVVAAGMHASTVPVDDAGARTGLLGRVDAVVLTPAHQFPIGGVLAPDRRARVIEWARGSGSLVVEDDYDGEFRYDRQPVGALQAFDPDHVVYTGSASKTLAPGLRLAWMVAPPAWLEPLVEAKRTADLHTGALEQLTLAELISSGEFDRHVRRCRLRYRRRRDRLVEELRDRVPGASVHGIAAGLHAVVPLRPGDTEEAVTARAARRGLGVSGLRRFTLDDDAVAAPSLVIGYATPPDHAFTTALTLLCDSLVDSPASP